MIQEKLIAMIAEQFGVEPETVTLETSFEGDLGADSIDLVELSMALEEEFSIDEMDEDDVATISTVGDLLKYVQAKLDDM
ncbi:MAG: acyl carrier protein [Oscillospiraceae bacterium]